MHLVLDIFLSAVFIAMLAAVVVAGVVVWAVRRLLEEYRALEAQRDWEFWQRLHREQVALAKDQPTQAPSLPIPPREPHMSQRDMMRHLWRLHGGNEDVVVSEYALAEAAGDVVRTSNSYKLSREAYASRLLRDGQAKGWLWQ